MSERIIHAINKAVWAHDGQMRKGTELPYVSHVFAVMQMVSQQPGATEDTQVAALLHDVLEDVPERYSAEAMEADFGPEVLAIVRALTKDESLPSWQARADDYLARLSTAPLPVVMIAACDKVHNLSSILTDYESVGEHLWTRFNSGKDAQRWWYHQVYRVVTARLGELSTESGEELTLPVLEEYAGLLEKLDAIVGVPNGGPAK